MVTNGKNNSEQDPVVGRYVNILLDDWFKRTFGQVERKRLLILVLRELFTLLFDCAEFTKLAPKEQIKYRHDMTTARDIANQIDYARKEGMSVGMERGLSVEELKGMAAKQ